jgi:hypothetical protein
MVRNTTDGEPLRLEVMRCLRCGAFRIHSRGGDRGVLDELLEFAVPVPSHSGWCSPEQPAFVDHREFPARQKRRKRARRWQRRDAA